ncbi:MAG TPA: hypothetical protein VJ761_16510 [Ktedonobacteraceae bacterium]|nr:hypothetical protein [Ktedonobacteraceae bacterium]
MQNLTTRSRPLGITIIAIIMAIQGILGIISGIMLIAGSGGGLFAAGIITLVLGVLYLILAWGLWTLQTWAYWATVVLEIIALLDGIFALGQSGFFSGIVNVVLAIVILIYLFADRNVRAAFRT